MRSALMKTNSFLTCMFSLCSMNAPFARGFTTQASGDQCARDHIVRLKQRPRQWPTAYRFLGFSGAMTHTGGLTLHGSSDTHKRQNEPERTKKQTIQLYASCHLVWQKNRRFPLTV